MKNQDDKTLPLAYRIFSGLLRAVNATMVALSATAVLVAMVLIGWSVVMRYVFNAPPVWVDEIIGFLLIAVVTLATADVLRRRDHIGVDILVSKLPKRFVRVSQVWAYLSVATVALIMIVNGWKTADFNTLIGTASEGYLEWPIGKLMLFVPMAGLMLLVTSLEALWRTALGVEDVAPQNPLHGASEE